MTGTVTFQDDEISFMIVVCIINCNIKKKNRIPDVVYNHFMLLHAAIHI
jgi:hypothetical protein